MILKTMKGWWKSWTRRVWIHIEYARKHRAAAAFIITMQASERWKSRRLQGIKMIKRPLSEHCTFVFQPSEHSCFFLIGHQHKKNIWSKSSFVYISFETQLYIWKCGVKNEDSAARQALISKICFPPKSCNVQVLNIYFETQLYIYLFTMWKMRISYTSFNFQATIPSGEL